MPVPVRVLVAAFCGAFLALAACRGGGARAWSAQAGLPTEVVRQLEVPENPYRIIYNPPLSLAKPPDTTAHGRKGKK